MANDTPASDRCALEKRFDGAFYVVSPTFTI